MAKSKPKQVCETVGPWLVANLGNHCLAPLTGTDARALKAAVQIVELYSYHSSFLVAQAFGIVVQCMQTTTQELAYHAIAHVMDWSHRAELWHLAGLPPIENPQRCKFE